MLNVDRVSCVEGSQHLICVGSVVGA
jgi:hypothetical protein